MKDRKEYLKQWYLEHKESKREYSKRYNQKHKEEISLYQHNYRQGVKKEVLAYYSNSNEPKCLWCGESRLVCLTLDHVGGGGAKHRKELRAELYRWLKKQGYPDGYQTLCANCQLIKRNALQEWRKSQ